MSPFLSGLMITARPIFVVAIVLSKNPIDAVRRADSTLDARRVATFVTAESLCSARPVCRLFPKCCSSSSWSSRAGSTSSRVTSLTLSGVGRGCGQAYALQTVEPVTYRCGTRRVCQARSSGSERYTRVRPHAVAPMNCVPEDSRRRSTCTGRTHSPRALADGHQTPSSTVAVRAPSPS